MRSRALALAAVVLLGLQGCSATAQTATVIVLASWSGEEADRFGEVLAKFEADEHIDVEYVGTRAVGQVLQSEVQKGTPPHIAVIPTLGEFATLARQGYLKPLDKLIDQQDGAYSRQWLNLEKAGTELRYAVTVKADFKSAIWYNPKRLPREPQTGAELMALGASWCLGMSAPPDSGWPGSDWIEDILLQQSGPQVYQDWAAGRLAWTSEPVRRAWETWGGLTGPVNAPSALLTEFADAARPMFTDGGCQLYHQASFGIGTYESYELPGRGRPEAGKDFDFFPFPSMSDRPGPRAWEVSADLAGMFVDTPEARKLMQYLASAPAQAIWPRMGSAFSVNHKVDRAVYKDTVRRKIAEKLTSDETLCFDASDLMPPTMRTTFYRAVLEYLNNPAELGTVLDNLDTVRRGIQPGEWLDIPCGQ